MTIRLAFYKGPPSVWWRRIGHAITCWRTRGPYSHVEFIAEDGTGWSSRMVGGVGPAQIDFTDGRWDVIETEGDPAALLEWFKAHVGAHYDWISLLSWVFPWRVSYGPWWFCSEPEAIFFNMPDEWVVSPNDLYGFLTARKS